MEQKNPGTYVARLVLSYLVLGSGWTVFSDGLIPFRGDPRTAATFSLVNGLLFVAVTAAVLALTLSRMPLRVAASAPLPSRPGWWPPVAILLAVGVAMIAVAYGATRKARAEVETRVEERLALEMRLKSKHVESWLEEHRATSLAIANDPISAGRLQHWLRTRSAADREELQRWLAEKQLTHPLDHFVIIDARGQRLLDDGSAAPNAGDYRDELAEAIQTGHGLMVDLASDRNFPGPHLELITPMSAEPGPDSAALLLIQEVDAANSLLQGIAERQDLSRSGEALLVRRRGDAVEFLSRLRFPQPGMEPLQLPIKGHPAVPAVRIINGEIVVASGLDYRGEPVLARGAAIPGTPWVLITKIDEAEAFADFEQVVRLAGGELVTVWLMCLLLTLHFWQRHRLQLAAEELRRSGELQAADRRFQELFRCAGVGMSISGLDGRLIDVNPQLCALTNRARADLVGSPMAGIIHPDDRPGIAIQVAEQLRGEQSPAIERRYLHRDGTPIPTLHSSSLVRDAHGAPLYFVGVIDDLSALEKSRQALRLSEERFQLAMRATRDGVWDWHLPSGEVYYSPGWTRMLGYEEHELEGRIESFRAVLRPEDAPRVDAAIAAVSAKSADTFDVEFRLRHRDGHYVDVLSRALPMFDQEGRLYRLVGTNADISERKTVEVGLRERLELQQYVDRVGDMLPGALVTFRRSADGRYSIPFASPRLDSLFELDRHQLGEDASTLFARVHPDDLERVVQASNDLAADGSAGRCEFRVVRPAGGTIWIEAHFTAERDGDGGTTWYGFLHDISDRKAREAQIQQAAKVFAGTHEGVVIADRAGVILAVNPAFSTITGYTADEVRGRNMSLLKSGRQDAAFYREMWRTIADSGFWQGEIWNRRKDGAVYPEWITISAVNDPKGEVINYVGTFSDISRMKDAEARLEHQARHDVLTGLPNRRGLRDEIEAAIARSRRDGRGGALLMLDLDRFKDVNDSLGHAAGDELLTLAAQRLRNALREVDLLARVGGDEFVVLIEALDQATSAARVAEQLIGSIGQPFLLAGGHEAYVGVSVGIANFDGDSEAGDLLKHADAALYVAKSEGRGTYRFHNSALTQAAAARVNMEGRLRRALEQGQFEVHYQPLVALADRRVTGVEALLRWNEPGFGPVSPADFIPLAEENGLIVPIGDWVLRTACKDFKRWREAGLPLSTIAVNLSPRQLLREDIHLSVAKALSESGLAPGYLELEITEGTLVRDAREVNDRLRKLKALGVRIAVDDFGTGYSSLVYLRRFPVDKIKIDRTFVGDLPDDPTDTEIVLAVIALGRILNLEVLAEGIERESQLEFLTSHGCTTGQGFLFGAAVPAEQIAGLQWPATKAMA